MEQPIRKIISGRDPKNGFAFVVGQAVYGGGTIHAIAVDGRAEQLYGRSRYLIYVENEDGVILWKAIENMPVIVEYDIDLG
jgi:hypothetical protein